MRGHHLSPRPLCDVYDEFKGTQRESTGLNGSQQEFKVSSKGAKGGQRASQKSKNVGKMICQTSLLNFDVEKIEKGDRCRAPGPGVAVCGGPFYYV